LEVLFGVSSQYPFTSKAPVKDLVGRSAVSEERYTLENMTRTKMPRLDKVPSLKLTFSHLKNGWLED